MTTLFTINKSWYSSVWLHEQLAFATNGDAILLIEDGVLALASPINLASFIAKCEAREIAVYALDDDLMRRGISNQYTGITLADYAGFVALVATHQKQVAW